MQRWSDSRAQDEEGELPLDASTQFVNGQHSLLYFGGKTEPLGGGWLDQGHDAIRAYSPVPQVYETLAELSLTDSPVKRQVPQGPPPSLLQQQWHLDRAGPPEPPARRRTSQAGELERANAELTLQVVELQEKLAAAERAAQAAPVPPLGPPPAFSDSEQEARELRNRLAARQREAQAAQQVLERAQAEAKHTAAQLQQERGKSAGLLDEVAQWRDEYHKMKKECLALHKKLESSVAQGGLLDDSMGTLKRQNSELHKALAQQEVASRELHERMQALQGQEGSRHKQLQQLMGQIEGLHSENAELQQQLHDARADECSRHSQMQQLWDERERLYSENASLRQQVQELNAELQHMSEAFAAVRSQLRERISRDSSMAADVAGTQQHAAPPAAFASRPAGASEGFYEVQPRPGSSRPDLAAERRPGTAEVHQVWQRGPGQLGALMGGRQEGVAFGAGGTRAQPRDLAPPQEALQQQHWAPWRHGMHGSSAEAAAAHEEWRLRNLEASRNGGREAGLLPPALRSLSFEGQQGAAGAAAAALGPPRWSGSKQTEGDAAAPGISPMEPFGYNPRASLPQPYNLAQQFRTGATHEGTQPLGGKGPAAEAEPGAAPGPTPSSASSQQPRSRLSSGAEEFRDALVPTPSDQVAAASPFGNDISLAEILARTKALEDSLMKLCMEKNHMEAELARMPANGAAGRKLQDRKRKQQLEERMEVVNKEISNIRLQLKRMGYK